MYMYIWYVVWKWKPFAGRKKFSWSPGPRNGANRELAQFDRDRALRGYSLKPY